MRGQQVNTAFLIGILILSLVAPVLAQGGGSPPTPNPGVGAPSGPGVGTPTSPSLRPGPGYGRRGFGLHRFGPRRFGAWMLLGGLFSLLRLLLLVGLILLVWRVLNARLLWDRLGHRQDPAAGILRERYARGEINEDEYRKRLATLA